MITNEYCKNKDNAKNCIENLNNFRSSFELFDIEQSVLQATYIRDDITFKNIIEQIFRDKMDFNVAYSDIDLRYVSSSGYNEINCIDKNDRIRHDLNIYINQLSIDNIYYCTIKIPEHVNVIFLNKKKLEYFFYEPHGYNLSGNTYCIGSIVRSFMNEIGYKELFLPKNILKQDLLPICYMYCLHFFIYMFMNLSLKIDIKKYNDQIDDVYIMIFTKYILKICYNFQLISEMDYYLLTNNMYKIQQIVKKSQNIIIENLIKKNANVNTLTIYLCKCKNKYRIRSYCNDKIWE